LERLKERDADAIFCDADIEDAAAFAIPRSRSSLGSPSREVPRQMPSNIDQIMADDIARQEEMEMEALLASLQDAENQEPAPGSKHHHQETGLSLAYFDEDDDYDEIFMELIHNEKSPPAHSQDVMDMW
jgi:hypothetical protein